MKLNEKLYAFFSEHVEQMAEEWIETMEESELNDPLLKLFEKLFFR